MTLSFVEVADGTLIYYRDWGKGETVMFSHGWPVNSDLWEAQMLYLAGHGYRVIAFDRRGHGRSGQPWNGYTNNQFADDLREIIESLGVTKATLIGHAMGGGEIARYVGRYGTDRVTRMAFVSGVPPLMIRTAANPVGLPMSVFEYLRRGLIGNRAQFYWDLSIPYFGYNRNSGHIGQWFRKQFVRLGLQSSIKASFDCIKLFSEEDFTQDLKMIDVPTLFIHGEDDQIVPVQSSSIRCAQIVSQCRLRIIAEGPHGLPATHPNIVNQELLSFLQTT
jgi:non-heme chloroperoxidase